MTSNYEHAQEALRMSLTSQGDDQFLLAQAAQAYANLAMADAIANLELQLGTVLQDLRFDLQQELRQLR